MEPSRDLDGNRLAATGRARDKGHLRDVVGHSVIWPLCRSVGAY